MNDCQHNSELQVAPNLSLASNDNNHYSRPCAALVLVDLHWDPAVKLEVKVVVRFAAREELARYKVLDSISTQHGQHPQ